MGVLINVAAEIFVVLALPWLLTVALKDGTVVWWGIAEFDRREHRFGFWGLISTAAFVWLWFAVDLARFFISQAYISN